MRNRLLITGAALTVTALLLPVSPASADPDPTDRGTRTPADFTATPLKPPQGMLQALQRDLGLTAEQVTTRLANEHRARQIEPKLRDKLKDRFGGSWVTDSGDLVVATTDRSATADITAAGAEAKVVQRPLTELDAVKEAIDKAAQRAPDTAVPVWYVDVKTNAVVIRATDPAAADRLLTASGADRSAVRVETTTEQPTPLYDVRGGDAYYINDSARCSVGFSVTRGSTGGFVTAGHCGRAGATTTGYNRVAQGTFQGSSFPGNDYAWVAVNSQWTPRGVVNGYSAGEIPVRGSAEAPVGSSVCRSGSTTQWHCGVIQQRNTSVTYPEGTVNQVVRTSVCAERGDSGGSYISGDQAQGVTSGGSGNCTVGGTTYFQPVNEILSAYNLTLVTSDSGQPPQTACTGYQNTYSGSLSSGQNAYQPDGSYYQTASAGTHRGCLSGPSGADFDLYLERWTGSSWSTVAQSISTGPNESLTYIGTAGYYRYRIHAYSGSGAYTMGLTRP
ncbi:S1 family peptidase [Thermostaphylospora chromogena]|uniref:Streptogrisin C n=1 Tax=Thermostaphylospora chromogena TaxID=35622 RepID=A0A1H1FYB3_9ACTN|nr:streptogrisin C [Thermostaphylospora chromogena]